MIDGVQRVKGSLGSLGDLEWGFGDNGGDAGFNTVWIRINDTPDDPDSKYVGYVIRGIWKAVNE